MFLISAFALIGFSPVATGDTERPDASASSKRTFIEDANHRYVFRPNIYKIPIWAGNYDETYLIRASELKWHQWGGRRTWSRALFKSCATEYGCSYNRGIVFAWGRGWTKCKPGPGSKRHYNWIGFRMNGSSTVKLWVPRCPYI